MLRLCRVSFLLTLLTKPWWSGRVERVVYCRGKNSNAMLYFHETVLLLIIPQPFLLTVRRPNEVVVCQRSNPLLKNLPYSKWSNGFGVWQLHSDSTQPLGAEGTHKTALLLLSSPLHAKFSFSLLLLLLSPTDAPQHTPHSQKATNSYTPRHACKLD